MRVNVCVLRSFCTGLTAGILSGCYVGRPMAGGVVVSEAPPPAQVEVVTATPGPEYVWIGGNWVWHDRWDWERGHWAARPHGHTRWEPGRWDHGHRGYVWHDGHWR